MLPLFDLCNVVLIPVMGNILLRSILSTSTGTQPKKYLKYKYQNTCCWGGELHRNT